VDGRLTHRRLAFLKFKSSKEGVDIGEKDVILLGRSFKNFILLITL
jgi:hypothetical protein